MLIIRKEQIEVFEQAALRNFEDQMVEHIKEFAPRHAEMLGESGVRQVVQLGMRRARRYDFTQRGPVRFYLEMMFMFGSDFDTDPQLPWAGEILKDPTLTSQMARADCLYDQAMEYVEAVAGPEGAYEKDALRRALNQRFEDLPRAGENFENEVMARLRAIHPQKCEYIGAAALRTLTRRGGALAERYALPPDTGAALLVGLMFAFGHGCVTDPQFPWIRGTLNDPALNEPQRRLERLFAKMMTYLRRALINIEAR